VAPSARGHIHIGDSSGIACLCLANRDLARSRSDPSQGFGYFSKAHMTPGCPSVGECHLRRLRFNGESDGSTGVQPATCNQRSSLCAFA
jgi:hypothetical protein